MKKITTIKPYTIYQIEDRFIVLKRKRFGILRWNGWSYSTLSWAKIVIANPNCLETRYKHKPPKTL